MINYFFDNLLKLMKQDKDIIVLVGDIGFSFYNKIKQQLPNQIFNCGISQQNMILIAGGLAKYGKKVYVYSISTFPTLRCLQQIRNVIIYHNLNIKIIAGGTGLSYEKLGITHYALQDVYIMNVFPNLQIYSPYYKSQIQYIINALNNSEKPAYIRLSRNGKLVNQTVPISKDYSIIFQSYNNMLITYGETNELAYETIKQLRQQNINIGLISLYKLKPIQNTLLSLLKTYKHIFILEEQFESNIIKLDNVKYISIKKYPSLIGDKDFLYKYLEIDKQKIKEIIKDGI